MLPGRPLYWTLVTIAILFVPPWFQFAFRLCARWSRGSLRPLRDGLAALGSTHGQRVSHADLPGAPDAALGRCGVADLLSPPGVAPALAGVGDGRRGGDGEARQSFVDILLNWTPAVALIVGVIVYFARPTGALRCTADPVLWACQQAGYPVAESAAAAVHNHVRSRTSAFCAKPPCTPGAISPTFSNEEHNWLIPDYVQENPPYVAARLSPTNLGFLFNARQAACEFGYLTVPEFVEQTMRTMATALRLPAPARTSLQLV